jgi:hypothetical protein
VAVHFDCRSCGALTNCHSAEDPFEIIRKALSWPARQIALDASVGVARALDKADHAILELKFKFSSFDVDSDWEMRH